MFPVRIGTMKLAKKRIKLWLVALKGTGGWGLKEKSRPTPILQSPIGGKKSWEFRFSLSSLNIQGSKAKSLAALFFALIPASAAAQSIVPAVDGTGTIVTPEGNRFDIDGGTRSSDRANLFHSFTQFGLSQDQIANFLSSPSIENILVRVVGGDRSAINGLIQVSGNSNLFLMNPAGIIFGAGASLNIPGSFTATTANAIGFPDAMNPASIRWFNATGSNNYAALVGTPRTFAFTTPQTPGAIVNLAQLAVQQNLSLIGGTVVSLGSLTAPGDDIAIASVGGESMVRISQPGSPLSLEVTPLPASVPRSPSASLPLFLPQLLTGGGIGNATELTVNSAGEVKLVGSGIRVNAGDVVVRDVVGQAVQPDFVPPLVSGFVNLSATGSITVLGKIDTSTTFADNAAGSVTMSAFSDINILNSPGGGIFTNSDSGDGGDVNIVSQTGSINIAGTINSSSNIADGGAISLTALDQNSNNLPNSMAGRINITGAINSSANLGDGGAIAIKARNQINADVINSSSAFGNGGSVFLDPVGDIQVTSINAQGGTNGTGGNVDITTEQFFRAGGSFLDQNGVLASISNAGGVGGGAIAIRHGGGSRLVPFLVGNPAANGTLGAVTNGQSPITTFQSFPGRGGQGNIQFVTPTPNQTLNQTELVGDNDEEEKLQLPQNVPNIEIDALVTEREDNYTREFAEYLGIKDVPTRVNSLLDTRQTLERVERETGVRAAIIYISFATPDIPPEGEIEKGEEKGDLLVINSQSSTQNSSDELEVVLVTAQGTPIRKQLSGITRSQVIKAADQFRSEVIKIKRTPTYLSSAQQLYKWIIAPLQADLQARGIQNIVFVPDTGLRSIPLAALHDGEQFLVEQYSVSLMPSLSLSNTEHRDIANAQVLAMGASKFTDQKPLPAVPVELLAITPQLWPGKSFLNTGFTLKNLNTQRRLQPYRIVHLATHAEFQPGNPSNSYIQLWDSKLSLNQLPQVGWNDPPVDLLVLSACRTALGDEQAEMGFAGLAVQAGVKSALASLWYVSDQGSLGLMAQFYEELRKAPVKAEALRQAQIAMIKGQIRIQNGKLLTPDGEIPLTPELAKLGNQSLSDPYYWAAFTMIGNPW
ncbi:MULTISPECIES: CHAT domain-containing protein [Cyanophyceae]|uniref:CHAT domain-containing protein n=1 Tax=Cyanophyceae TaxID=3028117 RepID=UPI0018EFFDAC